MLASDWPIRRSDSDSMRRDGPASPRASSARGARLRRGHNHEVNARFRLVERRSWLGCRRLIGPFKGRTAGALAIWRGASSPTSISSPATSCKHIARFHWTRLSTAPTHDGAPPSHTETSPAPIRPRSRKRRAFGTKREREPDGHASQFNESPRGGVGAAGAQKRRSASGWSHTLVIFPTRTCQISARTHVLSAERVAAHPRAREGNAVVFGGMCGSASTRAREECGGLRRSVLRRTFEEQEGRSWRGGGGRASSRVKSMMSAGAGGAPAAALLGLPPPPLRRLLVPAALALAVRGLLAPRLA